MADLKKTLSEYTLGEVYGKTYIIISYSNNKKQLMELCEKLNNNLNFVIIDFENESYGLALVYDLNVRFV